MRRVRLQYRKALELPCFIISLAAADGTLIEQAKTAAGVWEKASQVIVMDVVSELSTPVSNIPPGVPYTLGPLPCGVYLSHRQCHTEEPGTRLSSTIPARVNPCTNLCPDPPHVPSQLL